jgi:hypothetical protein
VEGRLVKSEEASRECPNGWLEKEIRTAEAQWEGNEKENKRLGE